MVRLCVGEMDRAGPVFRGGIDVDAAFRALCGDGRFPWPVV